VFEPTQWSLVLAAGQSKDPGASAALDRLCAAYWPPIYAYVRRRGHGAEDAQDLTQDFFRHLVESRFLRHARPERGRFRAFLIVSLKNFLANEWDRATARKRGEGLRTVDLADVEKMLASEAPDASPERCYEKQWAERVLEATFDRVRQQYLASGNPAAFEALKGVLGGRRRGDEAYRQLADELAMSDGAVRVAVHRLRQRYRAALRKVVGETLADPSEVDDEIRYLLSVVTEA
jgi:RNA polymerase sigma factor (sigma-70 family)